MSAPPEHADLLAAVADELMLIREGIDGIEALVSDLVRRAPPEERPARPQPPSRASRAARSRAKSSPA